MDSKDRPVPSVPALPARTSIPRLPALDTAAGRAGGAEPQGSVNIVRVALRAVTRHWWQILGLWALGSGVLCYLIGTNIKPQYEAASLLRVEPSRGDLFGTGTGSESFEPYLETQVQLMTSPNVLATALADPKASTLRMVRDSSDPEADLRKRLSVSVVPRSYLIRVAMTWASAGEAATAVNAVVDAYLRSTAEWSDSVNRTQIKNLETYQRELQNQSEGQEQALLELAAKGNIDIQISNAPLASPPGGNLPIPTRNRVTIEEWKRVKDALFQVQFQLTEAEAILSLREEEAGAAEGAPRDGLRLERAFRADPEAAALLAQLERARRRYDQVVRVTRAEGDPARAAARREVNQLSDAYRDLFREKRELLLSQLEDQGVKTPDRSLNEARENVQKLRALKASYEKHLGQLDVLNKQEGSDAVRSAIIREDLGSIKQMQKEVLKRLEQLRFESRSDARITRISEARANHIPVSDNRFKYMAASPAGILFCLLGLFVMLELKVGRIFDLDELSKQLPVEVFAVPPLPGPRLAPGQKGHREREARLQEFLQTLDHLRVALFGGESPAGTGRCVLVTSATAGEGKTTLTAQLSACCAKAGLSTLVIDADLRRATLSQILNEESTPGLSDVLQGELDPDAATVALPDAGFHFLAAGTPGRDPSWLLKTQRIGQLLSRYRQAFDVVIIDTPPVLPVPDALTLGRWTDGIVLTTRFDVSRMPLVNRARKRIVSAGIPLLKTVVNGVRTSRFYGGYGGHSGYGYGYGYGYGGYGGYGGGYGGRPVDPTSPAPAPSESP